MLSELIAWWIQQLADFAAPLLGRGRATAPDALLLSSDPTGTRIERRRKGRIEPVGTLAADAGPAELRSLLGRPREPLVLLLPTPLLVCETTLPAAAQSGLDRVLRYEMDRLTPFVADDVFFSHRLLGLDRARATVRVQLAFVPRAWVQPILDRLAVFGAVPAALEAAGPDGAVHSVPIGRQDPVRQARARLFSRCMYAVCGALALAIVALPLLRQSLALSDVDDRIAAMRPAVDQVEALRKRIADGSAGASRIAAAREQAGTILQMLGLLTDTLPDDTWLSSLTLRQRTLVMEGHSTASTKLIAGLAAEPRLHDPAFAAPVLRDENGGEVFTIRTGYGP